MIPIFVAGHPLFKEILQFLDLWSAKPNISFVDLVMIHSVNKTDHCEQFYAGRLQLNPSENDGTWGNISWPIQLTCKASFGDGQPKTSFWDVDISVPENVIFPLVTVKARADLVFSDDNSMQALLNSKDMPQISIFRVLENQKVKTMIDSQMSTALVEAETLSQAGEKRPYLVSIRLRDNSNNLGVIAHRFHVVNTISANHAISHVFDYLWWAEYNPEDDRYNWDAGFYSEVETKYLQHKLECLAFKNSTVWGMEYDTSNTFDVEAKEVPQQFVDASLVMNDQIINLITVLNEEDVLTYKPCA